jgi:lipoyl(octanoyl) transferase
MSSPLPRKSPDRDLLECHMGSVPYAQAVAIQERVRARRIAGELPDTLLLLEHPPVYTRGRRSADGELALGEDFYRAQGIDVVATDRGGRITYHGPGQLVGYPIMRIGAIDSYLRTMEQAIAAALAEQGIAARGRPQDGADYTGVWVDERKIASIGVHISHGVSTHGFAVNVDNDLQPFSWVVACGLPGVQMTSIAVELDGAASPGLACFRKEMAYRFCRAHGRRARLVSPASLGIEAPLALAPRSPARARDRAAMPAATSASRNAREAVPA